MPETGSAARDRLLLVAALLLAGLAAGITGLFLLADGLPIWSFYAVPWLGAAAVGLGLLRRRSGLQALGLALMTVPVWDTGLGILDSFGPLLQGGVVLRAYSTFQLSGLYSYKLVSDLGYLGVGFLLYAGGRGWLRQTPQSLARALAEAGLPMGRRSESNSLLLGLVAFPVLLVATVLVNTGLSGFESLRQSDESSVFANMTPYHAVILSLAAAFGEELLYRGLVQTALARRLPIVGAIVVQAVFFGLAHSGYATWIHVLLPTLFGLVAGVVAWRLGIWAAIVLHALVDIYAFGLEASAKHAWVIPILNSLLLANLALTIAWTVWWLTKRRRAQRQAPVA